MPLPERSEMEAMLARARAFCGHPRILDPELVTDPLNHPHQQQLLGSYGFFSPEDNRVYINVAEVLAKLGSENLEAVLTYQMLHYALAPFDVRTALRLTLAAKLALEEAGGRERGYVEAREVQRLFCDVVCVTYAATQGLREQMVGLYRAMRRARGPREDLLLRALLCLLEELWECRGELAGMVEPELRDEARALALRLLDRPFAAAGWDAKVRLFARFVLEHCESPEEAAGARIMDHGIDESGSRGARRMLRTLATEMGVEDFKELACGLGEGDEREALAWYYRDLARRYEVRFRPAGESGGEEVPYAPRAWGLGDPFHRLDLPYTLYTAGMAVPTLTTKQWEKAELPAVRRRPTPPDVLVILDASSSMTDPTRRLSHAVLAAFVMARSAVNLGARVGLIVYSDQRRNLTADYTWDLRPVERGMVTYYGGGTVFPSRDFLRLAHKDTHRPKHFCLISDTEISNIEEAADLLGGALGHHPGNSGSVFLIDQDRNRKADLIRSVGYQVFPVSGGEDLVRVVAGKAEELYAP